MTVSNSRSRFAAGALRILTLAALVAAAPLLSIEASAQDSGPLLLTPWPEDTDPSGAGADSFPTQPSGTGTSPATVPTSTSGSGGTTITPLPLPPAPEGERAPEGITVNALDDIATDYGGTLEPSDGGLGYDMWRGTGRTLVELQLPTMPIQPLSPAMRDLARRLLLSAAEPPQGPVQRNLMGLRAERLGRLGNPADIAAFLGLVRPTDFDAALAKLQLDALLLQGKRDEACASVRTHIVAFDADPYLQKAFAFCQMMADERFPAMLAADLLYEQGEDDPAFYDLMAALDGADGVTVDTLPQPTALHLAMLEAAGMSPPSDLVASKDPLILAALARSETLDPALRLAAAEQAAARGSYPVTDLVKLYRAVEAAPEERAAAMDAPLDQPATPRLRALLYQQALFAQDDQSRARYLQRSLDLARAQGGYMLTAEMLLPLLTDVMPQPSLTWFAADAARALFVMKRFEQATAWFAVVRRTEAVDADAAAAMPTLWLYARIAGSADPMAWDASSLAEWRAAHADDPAAAENALRLFAVFDGLGESVGTASDVLAAEGSAAGEIPNARLFFNLAEAAAAGRRGETVMLALHNLGEAGPGRANPIVLSRVLSSLRTVGLMQEARALAFEAVVAAGI